MPTEFLMPLADEHYEVDPPSQAEIDFDNEIDRLIFDFWKAALPDIDVTFQLPLALEALRKFKPVFQLDPERRDKLIIAIAAAAGALVQKLPHIYHPRIVSTCMVAATIVVRDWAEDEQQKAAHHPHRIDDAKLYVRILERDLHNVCDFAWLQQRKAGRQHEIVRSLLTRANDIATEQVAA